MKGLLDQIADTAWWLAALVACAAPRRVWPRLDARLPIERAAAPAGIITLSIGFAIGVRGFFAFAGLQADANNTWMIQQFSKPSTGNDAAIAMVPYGMSILTLFIFLFFTPIGLLSLYIVVSGTLRTIAATVDDAGGDPILSGLHWAATTVAVRYTRNRQRSRREELEGPEAPDLLQTGEWAGLPAVDYVVLASRRKAEWTAGAIILTSTDWYKLGAPFDVQTPAGMRTAYPLMKMNAVEVVRRGIQYELPRLARGPKRGTQRPPPTQG